MKSGRNLPKQTGPGAALGGSLSSSFPTCPDTCRRTRVLRPTGLRVCVCPGHASLVPPGLGRLESSPPRGRASSRMRLETFQQHRFHDPGLPWRRRRQGGALSRPPGSPRLGCICPGRFRKGSAPPSVAAGLSCLPPRTRGTEGPPRAASGEEGASAPLSRALSSLVLFPTPRWPVFHSVAHVFVRPFYVGFGVCSTPKPLDLGGDKLCRSVRGGWPHFGLGGLPG